MPIQDIYPIITRDVYSDPFYGFLRSNNNRLTAWYLAKIMLFSRNRILEGMIPSDSSQRFVDCVFFDDDCGVCYVVAAEFKGVHDTIGVLSFNNAFNFFKYIVNFAEFDLTGDPILDRKVCYLHDCIRRGYTIAFVFVTTALFDDACASAITKAKEQKFSFDFNLSALDENDLYLSYQRRFDEREKSQCVREFERPDLTLEVSIPFFGELCIEDKRSVHLLLSLAREHWNHDGEGAISADLLAIGSENGSSLQLFSILEGFCAFNGKAGDRLPCASAVLLNINRYYFAARILAVSSGWLNAAFNSAKGRSRTIRASEWVRSEMCHYDIRAAIDSFFAVSKASMASGTDGTSDFTSKAYAMPSSEFVMPVNRFFLAGSDEKRLAYASPHDLFFFCIKETTVNQDDSGTVDAMLEQAMGMVSSDPEYAGYDLPFHSRFAMMHCLALFSCFAVFSGERVGKLPSFAKAVKKMKSRFFFDEAMRMAFKSVKKACDRKASGTKAGSIFLLFAWLGTDSSFHESLKEIMDYFGMLSLINGDSHKMYSEYERLFRMRSKDFKYHLNARGFKRA